MNNITKKITCGFFLLLWLIPMLPMVTFHFQQKSIRQKMDQRLDGKDLQQIVMAEKDVIWADENEIWAYGKMFDIHSFKLENQIYIFEGLFDTEETGLITRMNESKNQENNKPEQLVSSFEYECPDKHDEHLFFPTGSSGFSHLRPVAVSDMHGAIPYPPPRLSSHFI